MAWWDIGGDLTNLAQRAFGSTPEAGYYIAAPAAAAAAPASSGGWWDSLKSFLTPARQSRDRRHGHLRRRQGRPAARGADEDRPGVPADGAADGRRGSRRGGPARRLRQGATGAR